MFSCAASSGDRQGPGAKYGIAARMSLNPPPTVKHTGQESWSELRNFQILIVSAVKICKRCLLTASASGGTSSSEPLPGHRTWTALGDLTTWAITPKWKFMATPLLITQISYDEHAQGTQLLHCLTCACFNRTSVDSITVYKYRDEIVAKRSVNLSPTSTTGVQHCSLEYYLTSYLLNCCLLTNVSTLSAASFSNYRPTIE